jgi:hypothetical protein
MRGLDTWMAFGSVLCGAYLCCVACGGHSGLSNRGTGGATTSGGTTSLVSPGSGGSTGLSTSGSGGTATLSTGGTTSPATGGSAGEPDAGTSLVGTGGATSPGAGGTGGAAGTDGSAGVPSCAEVTCPSIPSSCKKIVQDPNACCPVCTDTGCDPCAPMNCGAETHPETPAGACCPICVADPPNACTQGQQTYAALRTQLLDKYGSTKCQNSSDCVLLLESNACGVFCNVALPSTMTNSYQSNLASAATGCATCPTPAPALCELMVPACVNQKCVAANPS